MTEHQPLWLVYTDEETVDALNNKESSFTLGELASGIVSLGKEEWNIVKNIDYVLLNKHRVLFTNYQKIILYLFYWKGLSGPKIGQLLNISKTTVIRQRNVAMKKLKNFLMPNTVENTKLVGHREKLIITPIPNSGDNGLNYD